MTVKSVFLNSDKLGMVLRSSLPRFAFILLCALLSVASPRPSRALELNTETITFGIEPTAVISADQLVSKKHIKEAVTHFIEKTPGSQIIRESKKSITVLDAKNRKWQFHNDGGALEVSTPPLTLNDTDAIDPLFESFRAAGLKTEVQLGGASMGGGHIHVGRNIFDHDPMLLRNLIVYLENNPWIQGLFEQSDEDQASSLHDELLDERFKKNLTSLDARWNSAQPPDADAVASAYIKSYPRGELTYARSYRYPDSRFADINLTNIVKPKSARNAIPTVELRIFGAPRTAVELKSRIQWVSSLLKHLSKQDAPIPLRAFTPQELDHHKMPMVIRQEMIRGMQEIGVDPAPFIEQWERKFQPIAQNLNLTLREARTGIQPQVLELESIEPEHLNIELTQVSDQKPHPLEIRLAKTNHVFHPQFELVADQTWSALIKLPWSEIENVTHVHLEIMDQSTEGQSLTGHYVLSDGSLNRHGKVIFARRTQQGFRMSQQNCSQYLQPAE